MSEWITYKELADNKSEIQIIHVHKCGECIIELWNPGELREWLRHGLRPEDHPAICKGCS